MNKEDMNSHEKELENALRALAREEQGLATPPHVEARLMAAWDETRGVGSGRRRPNLAPVWQAAAALVIVVSGAYWWSRGDAMPPTVPEQLQPPAAATSWPSSETLAWLDPEPGSLQIIYVRVASATLAAQGYALTDPDGDGLVDLEVIVGADGTARGVRMAPATASIN